MISKKYAKDYRLENTLDRNGKLITTTVYRGEYYAFTAARHKLRRARAYISLSCALYWVFFWLGFAAYTGSMRQLYVSLPYFCGFLPAAYLSSSVYYLIRYSSRPPETGFTREQRDRVYGRMSQCSFATLLLAGFAAAGLFVYYILEYKTYGGMKDILVALAIAIMAAASAVVFSAKKHTKMQALS